MGFIMQPDWFDLDDRPVAPRLVVLQNNQFASSETQLALSAVLEKQCRSVCKALSPPPAFAGAHETDCTESPPGGSTLNHPCFVHNVQGRLG